MLSDPKSPVWGPRTRERRPAGQALHGEPVAVRQAGRQPDGGGTPGTGVPSRRGPPVRGALRPSNTCQATEAAICRLTGQRDLLDESPWLQRSIRVRNPYIDPMNYVQVALLRRLRGHPDEAEVGEMRDAVRLSVNGIAAGLRNTG